MPNPERYWLASKADFPRLVDPDVEDCRKKHSDRDEVDWKAVAEAASQNGKRILNGNLGFHADGDQVFHLDNDGLGDPEAEILLSWFVPGQRVLGDPGSRLENGRHRLFYSWRAAPSIVLPVYSGILLWEDSLGAEPTLGDKIRENSQLVMREYSAARASSSPRYWRRIRNWAEKP